MNPIITTPRTILRPYQEADRQTFIQFFINSDICRYMGDGTCETVESANLLFDKTFEIYARTLFANRHFEIWAIMLDNQVIGHFELKQTRHTQANELEVVYLLHPNFWGKGLMVEILYAIKQYTQQLHCQIIATVFPQNIQSIQVLEKIGIQKQAYVLYEGDDETTLKIWLNP